MPSDVGFSHKRAILVPDPRLTYANSYSASLSSVTQAGPLPGVPQALTATEMVLEATGAQSALTNLDDLRIQCQRAGQPGPDNGTFVWKYADESSTSWRGWDPPHSLVAWESLDYTTTASRWKYPHAIRMINGSVGCVVLRGQSDLYFWTMTHSSTAWNSYVIASSVAADSAVYWGSPTVLQLPSGRLLVFAPDLVTISGSTNVQIDMYYSDDNGATWALGQDGCLTDGIVSASYNTRRIRAAYLNGQILLIVWVSDQTGAEDRERLWQYASDDLGATFTLVSQTEGYSASTAADQRVSKGYQDITVVGGQFLVTYLKKRDSSYADNVPHYRRLGSAYQDLSAAAEDIAVQNTNVMEWCTTSLGEFTAGELSTWLDEDGILYMTGRDYAAGAADECYVQRSVDGGYTWAMVGPGSAPGFGAAWWYGRDGSKTPKGLAGVAAGGRAVVFHGFDSDTDNHDDSLCVAYLGGYTNVNIPNRDDSQQSAASRIGWEHTWLPFYEPDAVAAEWTRVVAGAPVASLTNATLTLTGTLGDTVVYSSATNTDAVESGVLAMLTGYATATDTAGGVFLDVTVGGAGPVNWKIRVRIGPDAVELRDMNAGTQIATASASTGVQVLVHLTGNTGTPTATAGSVQAWYRYANTTTGGNQSDRQWVFLGSSRNVQRNIVGAVANQVQFGLLSGVAQTTRIKMVQWSSGSSYVGVGLDLAARQVNPTDLLGRGFSPTPLYVDQGTKIAAVDGPAFRGDQWKIETRYEYGIENIFPDVSPSPRRHWRSTTTGTPVSIVWDVNPTLAAETRLLGGMIGLYLGNINFKDSSLWGYDAGGAAWVKIADIDAADGQTGLCFTRAGDECMPNAAVTGTPGRHWYTYHTLAGSYIKLDNGEQSSVIRKIRYNSEGSWQRDVGLASSKLARLILEGVLAGDPTGGLGSTAQVWSKDVFAAASVLDTYSRFKLLIPSQSTYEGYFRIGVAVLGHVAVLGQRWSNGRVLGNEHNVSVTTGRSGTRSARTLGPVRRTAEMAWVEGVDTSQTATATTPAPDYVVGYTGSTTPLAAPSDTPWLVVGLSEAVGGATTPVVLLPRLDNLSGSTAVFTQVNRNVMLYSRLVTDPRLESILGEEWNSPGEVFQIATITAEEEV